MNNIFLLIGGNLGNRLAILEEAKRYIVEFIGSIKIESSIYETVPWGFSSSQNFLNQVLMVSTELSPNDTLRNCLEIENKMGRVRNKERYASRVIDIDILFFNDLVLNDENLKVPHERLHLRRFTLEPLAEIASQYIHPVFKKSILELLKDCDDNSKVIKL